VVGQNGQLLLKRCKAVFRLVQHAFVRQEGFIGLPLNLRLARNNPIGALLDLAMLPQRYRPRRGQLLR
jgi:hypothetical protein